MHKFGGSSLANVDCFKQVKKILTKHSGHVVVSATKGTTSALGELLELAKNNHDFKTALKKIIDQHKKIAQAILTKNKASQLIDQFNHDQKNLINILTTIQITNNYHHTLSDIVKGYGEQWSARILASYLNATYIDAGEVLVVNDDLINPAILWNESQHLLKSHHKNKQRLVITGFIARTESGRRTTLGTNSSDYSAAIFAKLLKAKCLTIWTDVEGIYSADPTRVRSAFPIEQLSYEEALELAYFGAGVIHPKTLAPIMSAGIPIQIKNTFKPTLAGTTIVEKRPATEHIIQGLTSIDDVALVNVEGAGMIGVSGIAARVFQALSEVHISVIFISQASSEHSICFAIRAKDAKQAVNVLKLEFRYEIEQQLVENISAHERCAIVAAIGDGMIGTPGIAGKLTHNLAQANVNIRAIAQGSSERNISLVVDKDDVNRTLRAVHSGFYLSRKTIAVGLIGPGVVGGVLLDQINKQLKTLKQTQQANIKVCAIMNSKKLLVADDEINLNTWQQQLKKTTKKANIQAFCQHILGDDHPHSVVIDCTANQSIADQYQYFIEQGLHIITPNKKANSGEFNYYQTLINLAQKKNRHYFYETTVCAGLPTIKTLQDIIATGDEVLEIQGIVSGTLSYIFNELDKGKTFSDIIVTAKKLGYTEPDPRDDLSGMDVARKVVVLAREMGMHTELKQVKVHNLVPKPLRQCSDKKFMQELPKYDDQIGKLAEQTAAKQQKLAYVGSINAKGMINVDLKAYPKDHPFAKLSGTDNMLIFKTKRYNQQPLIIQGPGAGADVTAAGVFADLLRLITALN